MRLSFKTTHPLPTLTKLTFNLWSNLSQETVPLHLTCNNGLALLRESVYGFLGVYRVIIWMAFLNWSSTVMSETLRKRWSIRKGSTTEMLNDVSALLKLSPSLRF